MVEKSVSLPTKFECGDCGCVNYYVWGTSINGDFRIEVRCIRCGRILYSEEKAAGKA